MKRISEGIDEMEKLRGIAHHEFFLTPEANALFCGIKESIRRLDYQIPEDRRNAKNKKRITMQKYECSILYLASTANRARISI